MFEDDPWLDSGIEAEDDALTLKPRRPWFEYAGVEPYRSPTAAPGAPYDRAPPSRKPPSRKPEDPA